MENMLSASKPRFCAIPWTTRLVEVPISVTVPPRIAAKLRGISTREGARPTDCETRSITGKRTATTAVLLRKGDTSAASMHSENTRRRGPPSGADCAQRPIALTTPLFSRPSPSTMMAATVTVTRLESPAMACSAVMTPPSNSATGTAIATWSIGTRSVTKRISATSVTPKTQMRAKSMWRYGGDWRWRTAGAAPSGRACPMSGPAAMSDAVGRSRAVVSAGSLAPSVP
jgi:hypothetical protein